MVKVLQSSKNLLQKMGNTSVMEKARTRSLEDLSSVHNYLWDLRHVRKALWALCFNLENRSKKSDMDGWVEGSFHMCENSAPFQGAGSSQTQREAQACGPMQS